MSKLKLLFIDDQPDFLETMTFIRNKGYDVVTSTDGAAGVEIVKKGDIDIVFVDFKMPGMNGVETIKKIREFDKTIPVILVTAHADDALLRELGSLDIAGFFSKMGEFAELEQVLDVAIRNIKKKKGNA